MFSHLLHFWLMQFLMLGFAASATVGDVGSDMGGGDGSGDSSGDSDAGSDDAGVDDAGSDGSDELGDVDESLSADDGGADDQNSDVDLDKPVDIGDGRSVPGKIKKLFDLAKKAGVEKEIKQLFFSNQRLLKAVPNGVNGVLQLVKSLEEYGGIEGVQDLKDQLDTYSQDSQLFESGDPRYSESAFKQAPEQALKHVVHALNYMQENLPDNFDHIVAKYLVADFGNVDLNGIHKVLSGMKDNPEAQKLAKELADYYNSRSKIAKNAPENKPDAKAKELTERESAISQKEMKLRESTVNAKVLPMMTSQIGKALQTEVKARGIDLKKIATDYPGEYRDFVEKVHKAVNRMAMKDQRFLDKYSGLMQKGQLERAEKAINDKHASIVADAVREVMQGSGLFRGKKQNPAADKSKNNTNGAKGNAAAAANAGYTQVSARPSNLTIDWSKTTQAMQLDGKYILKDGKKVRVKY